MQQFEIDINGGNCVARMLSELVRVTPSLLSFYATSYQNAPRDKKPEYHVLRGETLNYKIASLRTGSPKLPETGAKRRPRGAERRKKNWEAYSQATKWLKMVAMDHSLTSNGHILSPLSILGLATGDVFSIDGCHHFR